MRPAARLRLFAPLALALGLFALPAFAAPLLDFAGYSWLVRAYGGKPGPNQWAAANAFVAADGLHLQIRHEGSAWTAAEVILQGPPLGFGRYEFDIAGPLDALDPNVVLGLFNYPGSPAIGPDGTNEIDIEIAQWGDAHNPSRLNWNIHPAVRGAGKGHHAVPLPPGADARAQLGFDWRPDSIAYDAAAPGASHTVARWTYAPKHPATQIPQQPLVVHMNLWLVDGQPPRNGKPVEIVIRDFRFVPL